jgi:hypothetical protein
MPKTFEQFSERDPRRHTTYLHEKLNELVKHSREDVAKISDPKAQALLETTAEVLTGLSRALEHYEQKSEPPWR